MGKTTEEEKETNIGREEGKNEEDLTPKKPPTVKTPKIVSLPLLLYFKMEDDWQLKLFKAVTKEGKIVRETVEFIRDATGEERKAWDGGIKYGKREMFNQLKKDLEKVFGL